MWEPKLQARLDSIKHHLMTGMAPHYVVDEIECLQRDLELEMKPNQDYDWLQPLEISLPGGRKVPYMMPIKYHSIPPLVIKIQPAGPTDEPEPAYDYGYTPKKSNSQEYVEGPLQHFLIKPGTQGQKKPKGALGLGPY